MDNNKIEIIDWTIEDVQEYLSSLNLQQYREIFEKNGINGLNLITTPMKYIKELIDNNSDRKLLEIGLDKIYLLRNYNLHLKTEISKKQDNNNEINLNRNENYFFESRISTIHAKIKLIDKIFYLKDEGSTNGTFIFIDKPIILKSGTKITISIKAKEYMVSIDANNEFNIVSCDNISSLEYNLKEKNNIRETTDFKIEKIEQGYIFSPKIEKILIRLSDVKKESVYFRLIKNMKIQLASEKIYYIEDIDEENEKEPNKAKKCECSYKKKYISSCNHYLCEKCFNFKNVKIDHTCAVCKKEFNKFYEFFEIEFYGR